MSVHESKELPEINLENAIPEAGIVVIVGDRGCGKTTLVHNIVWLKTPAGKQSVSLLRNPVAIEGQGDSKRFRPSDADTRLDVDEYPTRANLQAGRTSVDSFLPRALSLVPADKDDASAQEIAAMSPEQRVQRALMLSFNRAVDEPDEKDLASTFDQSIDKISPQASRVSAWNEAMQRIVSEWCQNSTSGVSKLIGDYATECVPKSILIEDDFYNDWVPLRLPLRIGDNRCLVLRTECSSQNNSLFQSCHSKEIDAFFWFPKVSTRDAKCLYSIIRGARGGRVWPYRDFAACIASLLQDQYECLAFKWVKTTDDQNGGYWNAYRTRAPWSQWDLSDLCGAR